MHEYRNLYLNVLQWLLRVNVLWHLQMQVFHDNAIDGIRVSSGATIHLHGEATAIHSNGEDGICAHGSSKVVIHLPSHHNTFYNNGGQDRYTSNGATITNVED